jgi:hypothetical protein
MQSSHRDHQQRRVVAEIPATKTPNRLQHAGLNLDSGKLSDLPEYFNQHFDILFDLYRRERAAAASTVSRLVFVGT